MELISCKDLSIGYDNHIVASDLSFCVSEGDYLCIVGENGAGKSTLMKTLLGLQKPISGKLAYENGLHQNEIGYLPQQTDIQRDFPASVKEVVLSGCLNARKFRPFYSKSDRQRCADNMALLGITGLRRTCYRELSGGQQQRVLLARALCATKKLLILDEPVAGLDPLVTAEMYAMIERLNKEEGITVVMVTHDVSASLKYATKILHVSHRPLFFGTKQEYLNTKLGQAFLGLSMAQEGGGEQ